MPRPGGAAAGAADARVQVFGFHLATVDLRQSSDKHEAVVAELLREARLHPDYSALDEDAKRACCWAC
jgi:phosphoenolpyruvate carboxylase